MHKEVARIQRSENWPTKERHLASPSEKGERSLGIPDSLTVASSSLLSSLFRSLFSFSSSLSFFSFSSFCGLIVGLFHLADGHLGRQRDPYRLTWFFLLVFPTHIDVSSTFSYCLIFSHNSLNLGTVVFMSMFLNQVYLKPNTTNNSLVPLGGK